MPSNEELVIYEIHVGDFSRGDNDADDRGQFKHVIEKIDYFKTLGINASTSPTLSLHVNDLSIVIVELMPIKEYAGNDYLSIPVE